MGIIFLIVVIASMLQTNHGTSIMNWCGAVQRGYLLFWQLYKISTAVRNGSDIKWRLDLSMKDLSISTQVGTCKRKIIGSNRFGNREDQDSGRGEGLMNDPSLCPNMWSSVLYMNAMQLSWILAFLLFSALFTTQLCPVPIQQIFPHRIWHKQREGMDPLCLVSGWWRWCKGGDIFS